MIIPTDESPGAKEAQVANYIDFVVFSAANCGLHCRKNGLTGWIFWNVRVNASSAKHFARPRKRIK